MVVLDGNKQLEKYINLTVKDYPNLKALVVYAEDALDQVREEVMLNARVFLKLLWYQMEWDYMIRWRHKNWLCRDEAYCPLKLLRYSTSQSLKRKGWCREGQERTSCIQME